MTRVLPSLAICGTIVVLSLLVAGVIIDLSNRLADRQCRESNNGLVHGPQHD